MRRMVWIAAVPALMITVYCAAWWYVSERAREMVLAKVDSLPADLATVTPGEMRRGGFPFAVRWNFDAPTAMARWALGESTIRAGELSIWSELWTPSTIRFSAKTVVSAVRHDPTGRAWRLTLGAVSGRLQGTASGGFEVLYDAGDLRVDEVDFSDRAAMIAPVAEASTASGSLVGPIGSDGAPGHQARLALAGLGVAPARDLLGDTAGTLEVSLELRGSLGDASIEDVVAWRDAGGVLEINRLDLDWQPLDVGFEGTMALDEQLRLLGAGTAEIRGLTDLLDILVGKGVVKRSEATVAKLGLALLTRPAKDGGAAVVRLPLTAQNGVLRGGPFVLGRLPPIIR